jgi:hypothetical protein
MVSLNRANNSAKAVDQLVGICTGILADGEVNENEAIFFAERVRQHAPDEPVWPFTDVLQRLERVFADGMCDAEERTELKGVMKALCGYTQESLPQDDIRSTTLPLCAPQPALVFTNQQFVVAVNSPTGLAQASSSLLPPWVVYQPTRLRPAQRTTS